MKVTQTHSPPHDVENVSEPFIRPSTSTTLPGSGFSAEKHQPTSKAVTSQQTSTTKFPGTGSSTSKHQPVKLNLTDRPQLQGFLDRAPLLLCSSLPVKPKPAGRQLQPTLHQNCSLQVKVISTDLTLTDPLLPTGQLHLSLLTPAPLLFTGQGEIASPAFPLMPVVCCLIRCLSETGQNTVQMVWASHRP